MIKNSKNTLAIVMLVILGISISAYSVEAAQPETPNLTELIQKILDAVLQNRQENTQNFAEVKGYVDQVEGYVDETEGKMDALSSQSLRMYTDVKNRLDGVDTKIDDLFVEDSANFASITDQLGIIQDKLGHSETILDEDIVYIKEKVEDISLDLYNQNIDEYQHYLEIKGYVDQVESNQADLLGEVDDAEEKLDEIYNRQTTLNYNAMTQLAIVDSDVRENGEAIDVIQTTADELAVDIDAILAELALIKQSIEDLEDPQGNVIMKTSSAPFSTLGGNEIVFSRSYDSIRHVSITFHVYSIINDKGMALADTIVSIIVRLPDGQYNSFNINEDDWEPLLHLEFDTDYWEVHVGKTTNNDYTTVGMFNIVTFEEA